MLPRCRVFYHLCKFSSSDSKPPRYIILNQFRGGHAIGICYLIPYKSRSVQEFRRRLHYILLSDRALNTKFSSSWIRSIKLKLDRLNGICMLYPGILHLVYLEPSENPPMTLIYSTVCHIGIFWTSKSGSNGVELKISSNQMKTVCGLDEARMRTL